MENLYLLLHLRSFRGFCCLARPRVLRGRQPFSYLGHFPVISAAGQEGAAGLERVLVSELGCGLRPVHETISIACLGLLKRHSSLSTMSYWL